MGDERRQKRMGISWRSSIVEWIIELKSCSVITDEVIGGIYYTRLKYGSGFEDVCLHARRIG